MPQTTLDNDLGEYSHYAREVMGTVPSWTVRWGTTVVMGAIATLIFVAWWIKYPEVVPAQVTVTTPTPPARVVARIPGKLTHVRVHDQQVVAPGAILAVIENSADADAVLTLREHLTAKQDATGCPTTKLGVLRLGPVQEVYATYQARCTEYLDYVRQHHAARQQNVLQNQRRETASMFDVHARQAITLREKRDLVEKDVARLARLRSQGIVSEKQVDDKQSELLDIKRAQEQLDAEVANTRIDIARVDKERVDLTTSDEQRLQETRGRVQEAYQNLLARIAEWDKDYVLRAPIPGRVSFFNYWSDNQFVAAGDEVMTLVPLAAQNIVGKMRVPLDNSGKLRVGQDVHIRLTAFPYQEYGLLEGRVSRISLVPRQESYAVEVTLPAPLTTTFGKQLAFLQEMEGRADIVTKESRLINRIFRELMAPFTQSLTKSPSHLGAASSPTA